MAPHAGDTESPWTTSSYTPSAASIDRLKKQLRLNQASLGQSKTWVTDGPQAVDSLDSVEAAQDSVLQLTLEELQEIEDAAATFDGKRMSD
jgi:hypothetical protein